LTYLLNLFTIENKNVVRSLTMSSLISIMIDRANPFQLKFVSSPFNWQYNRKRKKHIYKYVNSSVNYDWICSFLHILSTTCTKENVNVSHWIVLLFSWDVHAIIVFIYVSQRIVLYVNSKKKTSIIYHCRILNHVEHDHFIFCRIMNYSSIESSR
jgi:hypothetical protein